MMFIRPFQLIVLALVMSLLASCSLVKSADADACTNNLDSPVTHFCEVTPGVLWRGAKPGKYQARWLIENGMRTLVNLELLHDDRDTLSRVQLQAEADDRATLNQTELNSAAAYQVDYYRVRDWEPLVIIAPWLTDTNVAQFLAVMQRADKPVYVHCRSGQNRTGVMVAAYQVIAEGKDSPQQIEAVIADMKAYRGFWFRADAAYIRGLTAARRDRIRRLAADMVFRVKPEAQVHCLAGRCRVSG
jgi:protein tyrosine phosphatase (PTP) superfamily phosphohydrolase (DUF442 family)